MSVCLHHLEFTGKKSTHKHRQKLFSFLPNNSFILSSFHPSHNPAKLPNNPIKNRNNARTSFRYPSLPISKANKISPLQRHQTLPPAQTSSAREALQSFYCQLCQKGYSRMNDYEAHLSSYDHSHKQRLKDMKAMVRDPNAAARARRQEQKAEGVISIKLGEAASAAGGGGAPAGGGFKKGGFKKTGFKSAFVPVSGPSADAGGTAATPAAPVAAKKPDEEVRRPGPRSELVESDTEDEGYEMYDPRKPTD